MRSSQLGTGSVLVSLFLALFGSALGQSFPGQGQGAMWTAPGNIGSTPAVLYADGFPGSDPCAKINAAIAALPITGGIIDARAFQGGPLTCSSNPFPVAANVGTISATAGNAMVVGSGTQWLTGSPVNSPGSHVGAALFCGSPAATFLGIVANVTSQTQLTLAAPALANCTTPTNSYTISAKSGELLLGNATYSLQFSWIIPDRWRVIGSGRGFSTPSGTLPTGTGTSLQANSSFGPITNAGSIAATMGNTLINGTSTSWTSALVGSMFISGATSTTPVQGVVASVGNMLQLTLSTPAQNLHSGPYAIVPPLVQFNTTNGTLWNTPVFGVSISNLLVDCSTSSGTLGIQNWWAQELSYVRDVNISECSGISLDVETVKAQNSGPYANIASSVDTSVHSNADTLCLELLNTGDLRGIHGLTCIGSISGTAGPNVGVDLSTQSVTLEDLHFEGYTTGIEVGLNGVSNNSTIINATGGTGVPGTNTVVDIANSTYAGSNEVGIFGLNTGGVANVLNDEIMSAILPDQSLSFYVLGRGTGTSRTRLTSSPNASNLIGGATAASPNGSGGGVSVSGGIGVGTGNGGNVTIQAGGVASGGTGANGQLQVLQPFTKGSTVTVGDLECLSSANTVSDCTNGNGNFVGVAAASSGNSILVLTHGVVNVNISNPPSTPGDFICQQTGGQAKEVVPTAPCGVLNAVGIATTSAATSPVPVLITRF